jgi:hypothetical protein
MLLQFIDRFSLRGLIRSEPFGIVLENRGMIEVSDFARMICIAEIIQYFDI